MRPDWHPIDSAPKDGRRVLLCRAGYLPVLGCWLQLSKLKPKKPRWRDERIDGVWMAFDSEGCFVDDDELLDFINGEYIPTHWAECPEGPERDTP